MERENGWKLFYQSYTKYSLSKTAYPQYNLINHNK